MASRTRPTWWSVCSTEPCVDLHLTFEDRFQVLRHVVPRRDLLVTSGQLGICRDDTELLLSCERALPQRVPPVRELPCVLVGPLLGHMVRRVGSTRREVHEERPVRHQCLLLAHPTHC